MSHIGDIPTGDNALIKWRLNLGNRGGAGRVTAS